MAVDPRLADIVHSLETLPMGYDDFVRFVPDAGDDRLADIVKSTELFDEESRRDLRTLMTDDAITVLRILAMRRVVLGLRTSNASYFHQALSACALLPTVDDIPWSRWFAAALLLGNYANDPDIVALFEGSSTAGGERCAAIQHSLRNGGTLAQCHLVQVETSYGIGLIRLPYPEDAPARSLIQRDYAAFSPTFNLAQAAVDIADGVDKIQGASTSRLEYAQLADGRTGITVNRGCIRFSAMMPNGVLDVSVAEMMSDADAIDFKESFVDDEAYVIVDGAAVVLFMAEPNFDDDAVPTTLDTPTLDALAMDALRNKSP